MPEISRFLGIIILMVFNDHDPPHFHVQYNEFKAIIDIETLALSDGKLPGRVLGLVIEWAELRREDLLRNWLSLRIDGSFHKVAPLV